MNKCPFRFSDSEVSYVEDEIFRGEIDIKTTCIEAMCISCSKFRRHSFSKDEFNCAIKLR